MLVAKGYAQLFRVNFSKVFTPISHFDTIRMLNTLIIYKGYHLDVKYTFLNGLLE